MAGANSNITVRLLADTASYEASMAKAGASAEKVAGGLEKTGSKTGMLTNGLALAGAAATAFGVMAVKTFAEFDASMSTVQANTGATASQMDALRQAAIEAGASTVYSASEAADAINELGKAGMSTSDVLSGGLSGALNLAASDGMEVAEAAELMSSAMAQFNLTGADAGRIADALAAGAGKAQGSAHDLGYALQQSGMVANSFGIGMEETVGTLTAFANAGMIGSDAGTSLKTMLIALANPSDKAAALMDELGISAYDAQGNFIGLANLAGVLQTHMSGLTQEQRNQALATIFGSDAIRAANVLYKEGADGIDDWTKAVSDSGFAAEQAAAKNDNLKGDLENLSGSIESLMINIGSGANGPMRALVQTLDMVVDGFSQLPAPVQQWTVLATAAVGGAAALHKALTPLSTSSSAVAQKLAQILDPVQALGRAAPGVSVGVQSIVSAFSQSMQVEKFGMTMSRTAAITNGFKSIGSGLLSMVGGPWGVAFAAAATAVGTLVSHMSRAKAETEALDSAMQGGADSATALANAIINGQWGDSKLDFGNKSKDVQSFNDALKATGITAAQFSQAASGNKDALDKVNAALKEHEDANNKYIHGVNVGKAQTDLIRDALNDAKTQIGDSKEKTKELADANEELGQSGSAAADGMTGMADATSQAADASSILADSFGATTDGINEQSVALGEVIDAMNTYYGFATSASDAAISMYDSFDKATQAAAENGRTLDLNTEKGRNNQSALNDMADAALKNALAQSQNGASMSDINGILDLAYDKYVKAAEAMGMTPEQADAAAKAAGLTSEAFDKLAQSAGAIPTDKNIDVTAETYDAADALTAIGLKVEHLPNGDVRITGDNTDALAVIAQTNGIKLDPKTGQLTLDKNQFDIALALANGAKIDPKTGKLIGDGSDLLKKVAEANGWKIDKKTGVISGDDGPFKATKRAVENEKIAGKTVKVNADASGFWGTVNGILGRVFKVNVQATGKARGGPVGYATGGRIPGLAGGGFTGYVNGVGTATSDSNLIMASKGEFMAQASAVDYYGTEFFHALNKQRIPREALFKAPTVTVRQEPRTVTTPALSAAQMEEAMTAALSKLPQVSVFSDGQAAAIAFAKPFSREIGRLGGRGVK